MAAEEPERACWICLASDGNLVHACKCPTDRVVHSKCLARWQLQSAGRSEEHACRFCNAVYPSWKDSLTPVDLKPAIPVVSVHYNGSCYRMQVRPGPQGLDQFRKQLQSITGMSELDCMQITFQCKAPETAQELNFKGISAFDAAIHCASISAAEREKARASSALPPPSPTVAASSASTSAASIRPQQDRVVLPPLAPAGQAGRRSSAGPFCTTQQLQQASQHPPGAGQRRGHTTGEQLLLAEPQRPQREAVAAWEAPAAQPASRFRFSRVHEFWRSLFV